MQVAERLAGVVVDRQPEGLEAVDHDMRQLVNERSRIVVEHADRVDVRPDYARHLAVAVWPVLVRLGAGAVAIEERGVRVDVAEQRESPRVRPQLAAVQRAAACALRHGVAFGTGAVVDTPACTPQNSVAPG